MAARRIPRRCRGRGRGADRRTRRARRRGTRSPGAARAGAERRLSRFRQATLLATATTGILLLIFAPDEAGTAQEPPTTDSVAVDSAAVAAVGELPDTVSIVQQVPLEALQAADSQETTAPDSLAREGTEEATQTLQELWLGFYALLPKLGIALGVLLLAWLLSRVVRPVLRWGFRSWQRGDAATALIAIALWLLAIGVALSVLAGDFRALIGSLGLVGLALSWALQTPIESFTGWLLNSFRGYYRVGDRIAVGEVYGDVYRIDVLTTTVWEYGGAERPGVRVQGEQATGRLITFPNNELLTGSIINLTRDFPYVWDELSLEFSGSSDPTFLLALMRRVADQVIGEYMHDPAETYAQVLQREGLEPWVARDPEVFLGISDNGWLEGTIRYLVAARERRRWKSRMVERLLIELETPEAKQKIRGAFPKRLVQFLDETGAPRTPWREMGGEDDGM